MTRRTFDPAVREQMDLEQPVTPELERDLANLVTLNRLFGSHAIVREFLSARLDPGRRWRILDLATGAGDIPRLVSRLASERRIEVEIDAVDAQSSTLEIARRNAPPDIRFHCADIRNFGEERIWDIVLCSLALHHFSDDDAALVLRRAAGLSRKHVLVTDLRRCTAGTLGVDLLTTLWMREPMTRHDARISVRRAFSFQEMAAMARRAGWTHFEHQRRFCFRQALWMDFS
jgi:Methylase involved in ubiquinone/menaquinone biosynthesis